MMKSMLNVLYKVKASCRATNQLVFILIIIILFNIVIQPLTLKAQKCELKVCFSDTQTGFLRKGSESRS